MSDTIFAQSSGAPPAAIAIVRVSGAGASTAARQLIGRKPEPRRATLVRIVDPATELVLDRALALFFPGPGSATGEDLLELHVHGGRAVVASVLHALGKVPGLRLAEAGEFTRRAVANGRLDLLEAEALGELLVAETELQRRVAQAGATILRTQVDAWRDRLMTLSADIEAAIDHDVELDVDRLRAGARRLVNDIDALLARPPVERIRDGFTVVIGGPPNAGKSTLFNALLSDEAAIVSPIAGTTRDALERVVSLGGVPVRLIDTAGQRDAGADPVEAIGIARAEALAQTADLLLWIGSSKPPRGGAVLRVQTRCDVVARAGWADVAVSGLTGAGLTCLVGRISDALMRCMPAPNEALVNRRQRAALVEASEAVRAADHHDDLVLVAAELERARRAMDVLTGRAGVEDLLDSIFERFCLGK